jgi:outer membrane murein-binding lipoprotein Lpp
MQAHPHPGRLRDQLNLEPNNPTLNPGGLSIGDSPQHGVVHGPLGASFHLNSLVMVLKIILGAVLVLSQLAGVAGFVLGIYNYRQTKKQNELAIDAHQLATKGHELASEAHQLAIEAPIREDQRRFRAELRDILYAVKAACTAALERLSFGDALPKVPQEVLDASDQLLKLRAVLISPGYVHLVALRSTVDALIAFWESAVWYAQRDLFEQIPVDEWRRRRDASESTAKEYMSDAVEQVDEFIKVTVDIDNGNDEVYELYSSYDPELE